MLSETPFAFFLMALYEQIHMCTGRGKLYECAFVFEKMYEQSQIKLIFYKSEFHAFSEAFSWVCMAYSASMVWDANDTFLLSFSLLGNDFF